MTTEKALEKFTLLFVLLVETISITLMIIKHSQHKAVRHHYLKLLQGQLLLTGRQDEVCLNSIASMQ